MKTTIIKPRITEKAAILQDKNVYVFQVAKDSTKPEIKKEIERIYKVSVVNVNTVVQLGEKTFTRGQRGKKNDFKKAYVTVKDGDSISLV